MKKKKLNKEKKLKEENKQLKKALAVCINKPLVKNLSNAMKRIKRGEYYTEEEFFKDSPLITA